MSSVSAPTAAPLWLKAAAHFVALKRAGKSQGYGAPLDLHAERHIVSSNRSSQRRRPTRILKRSTQFGTLLLNLYCGLL